MAALQLNTHFKKIAFAVILMCFQLFANAQDSAYATTTTTTTTTNDELLWYMQPWAWITGGVAVLLLLLALFSGGKKKATNMSRTDRVIITKTVRTETDIDEPS